MDSATILIALGTLFLAGLALDAIGHQVHIPRVTLLILLGMVVGPPMLDLIPLDIETGNQAIAPTALTMVAFLLGGSLHRDTLSEHGREILVQSIAVVVASVLIVAGGLFLIGLPLALAILLGAISAATDPAATQDVIRQSGRTGPFARRLLGIVAIDDLWGLIVFSVALTLARMLVAGDGGGALIEGAREMGGAIGLGLAIGVPAALLTGRLKPGEPTLIEAIGVVFLIAGFALWLDVSFLLAGIVCGATVANLARHHDRPFHEIERIEWPFLLLFFVMAGASLQVKDLGGIGWWVAGFVVLRVLGRIVGGWAGGRMLGQTSAEGVLTGLSLVPQAGVAVGMALVAAETFPEYGPALLAITITTTILFELAGPILASFALSRAGGDSKS